MSEMDGRHDYGTTSSRASQAQWQPPPLAPHQRHSGNFDVLSSVASVDHKGSPLARRSVAGGRRYTNHAMIGPKTGGNLYSVQLPDDVGGVEMEAAKPLIYRSMEIRDKYKSMDKGQQEGSDRLQSPLFLQVDDGIFRFSDQRTKIVAWEQFYDDAMKLMECTQDEKSQIACRYRLQVLEEKYYIYKLCNGEIEESTGRNQRGGGVFAHSTKVDNCVGMDKMMNAQWLVDYIVEVMETHGDDEVGMSDTKEPVTLSRMMELWDIKDTYLLTPGGLGIQPSPEKPSAKYDPLNPDLNRGGRSCSELLRLFLSRDTLNEGAYFADAVRPSLCRNEGKVRGIQATETVIEITGLYPDEWEKVAEWVEQNELSHIPTNTYIISFNRQKIKDLRRAGTTTTLGPKVSLNTPPSSYENYQQHLDNLFLPLFLATMTPEDSKNIHLANLLTNVGGFMIAFEDEECVEAIQRKRRRPADVNWNETVGDLYFAYYIWANLCSLNSFRRRRNMNVFHLRGIAGSQRGSANTDSILGSYMFCDSIINGIALENQPVLQYLYGMKGIGISMYPLTSNGQGVPFVEHPFCTFFRRGLKVSLCTMHPLFFHHSMEPLIEEYGTASKLFRMSGVDMCEIALNSVMMSTFTTDVKCSWLGESYVIEGNRGNNFSLSFVPTARLEFRQEMWISEMEIISPPNAFSNGRRRSSLRVGSIADPLPGTASVINDKQSVITFDPNQEFVGGTGSVISKSKGGAPTEAESDVTANQVMGNSMAQESREVIKQSCAPYAVFDPRIDFPRLRIIGPYDKDAQYSPAAHLFHRALELRSNYTGANPMGDQHIVKELMKPHNTLPIEIAFSRNKTNSFDEDEWTFKTVEGVVVPHEVHQIPRLPKDMYHYEDFRAHVEEIRETIDRISVQNFAAQRLKLLEHKFNLHTAVNHSLEAGSTADKASQNRDFYQSTKVDNTIRMETGMTARQLLDFIVSKAHNNGDDIVSHQSGKEPQTLRQLLSELKISPDFLTVDDLNVQVNTTSGMGSDQYTPEGRDELLTLLLKTDNQMKGRYFAELTKLTFENLKRDRFTFTENRLPIYGASEEEWALVSTWFDTHGMSSSHNQWMIQIPRIYGYLRKKGKVANFGEYLENIFRPLWSVSLHPNTDPRLFHFVNHISGFDCIEDERRHDTPLSQATTPPHEWISEDDPPYNYYMYHIWANIFTLNEFRRRREFTTFLFRPSCGEAGQMDHLVGAFLLSNGISYGVQLGDNGPLQYLFYLAQIGVTVSPLSNNTKVLGYLDNPFPKFFRRGLMVTLGTDSPLMYHHTQEPLLEEYSIASKIWKLSPNDLCEIARNSVLLSGFSPSFKQERLGKLYFLASSMSNDSSRTHLSDVRVSYRFETYHSEIGYLEYVSGLTFQKSMLTLAEEEQRKTHYLEQESMNQKSSEYRGIIDSQPEQKEIKKLLAQRNTMETELEELIKTMAQLQQDNKLITEKLVAERTKEQQEQLKMRNRTDKESVRDTVSREFASESFKSDSRQYLQTSELVPRDSRTGDGVSTSTGLAPDTVPTADPAVSFASDLSTPPQSHTQQTIANALLMHKETLWSSKDALGTRKDRTPNLPSIS